MNDHARVLELRIRNVGPIEAADITPTGCVVEGRGPNAVGKTTALNSLSWLMEGTRGMPDFPIREGAKQGEIVGVIGSDRKTAMVIRRVLRKNSTELTVTRPDGTFVSRPQEFCGALVGHCTVRAKAFTELSEAEQKKVLAEVAGIDLAPLRDRHEAVYAKRTVVNREVDRLTKAVAAIPTDDSVEAELRDVAELMRKLAEAHETRLRNDSTRARVKELESQHNEKVRFINRLHDDRKSTLATVEQELRGLEKRIKELTHREESVEAQYKNDTAVAEHERDGLAESVERQSEQAEKLSDPDTSTIEQQIAEADTYNEKVRAQARRVGLARELQKEMSDSEDLTAGLEEIKAEVGKTIREAPMPIKGLAYTTDGVMFKGLPFSQASTAEALAVSVAIGCKRSPKLRAMTFDDGAALDTENREKLYKLVHDAGMLVLIAIVDDSAGNGELRIVDVSPKEEAPA